MLVGVTFRVGDGVKDTVTIRVVSAEKRLVLGLLSGYGLRLGSRRLLGFQIVFETGKDIILVSALVSPFSLPPSHYRNHGTSDVVSSFSLFL